MPTNYKFVYFDARGRAEVIRLTFAAAKKEFEDKRLTFEQWGAEKAASPQGFLPFLEIDGKTRLCQSLAILRYQAREFNLYGKGNIEMTLVDTFIETTFEIYQKGIMAIVCKDESKKPDMIEDFKKKLAPQYMEILEKTACGQGGFLVGKTLTVADIFLFAFVDNFELKECLAKFPKLQASCAKLEAIQGVKDYLKKRPATKF